MLRYHFDARGATTITQNQQTFAFSGGPREMAANTAIYNWALAQLPTPQAGAYNSGNPAMLRIKVKQTLEIYNTGASILYVKWHKWICREDINSIAGQTDTLANIIAHGVGLVTPAAGTNAMAQTTIGYNLFMNPFWCRRFKAVKAYSFHLLPGERRTMKMRDFYTFDQKEVEPNGSAPVSFMKGYQVIAGYVYGQPSFDSNLGAAPTAIGTAAGGMIAYSIFDTVVEPVYLGNKVVSQATTSFNQATAGQVWQSVASADTAVTKF